MDSFKSLIYRGFFIQSQPNLVKVIVIIRSDNQIILMSEHNTVNADILRRVFILLLVFLFKLNHSFLEVILYLKFRVEKVLNAVYFSD